MRFLFGSLVAAVMLVAGPASAQDNGERDDIVLVSDQNKEMNIAIAKARKELPLFYKHLGKPAADESNFSVKFNLTPNDQAEFIWANDPEWINGQLYGTLSNVPYAPEFSQGQRVLIPQDDIVDWGFYRGDVMQGNYTTRVLLGIMPPEDAARIKNDLGW